MLRSSTEALCLAYDLAMLDLDGVIYIGRDAVPGAADALGQARRAGQHLAFVTNNAARPPAEVARHLRELGVEASAQDVVTSAQAAARLAASRVGPGARVLALGGPGVADALAEAGLVPVDDAGDGPVAVVSGYGPELSWRQIMRGAMLIADGLPWIASNRDLTIPTAFGVGPGHGALVDLISTFSGVTPEVAGKPERPLLDETIRRVGGSRPLMVGDRLDTDIEGAVRAGVDSLLVLTGVTGLTELLSCPEGLRPTYLAPDLRGLLETHEAPSPEADGWQLGGWQAGAGNGHLTVAGAGSLADWYRVVAAMAWAGLDTLGHPLQFGDLRPGLASAAVGGR